ncbi:MAG: VIT1/CCC1 transporter family protein [Devosiaceae bacterium]|nr:VIT1/CCC1 transporter family protein [Devosiaceae bacterium]
MDHSHEPDAIRARLAEGPKANYLRDWIYGGIDGAITTFAIVAGVVGANLSVGVILVLGLANLVADGFSMAASNYSGTKSEHDDYERIKAIELRHIRNYPEGEVEEIRQIYARKGFEGKELEAMVKLITAKEDVWLDTMLKEEHSISPIQRSPIRAALATFIAFSICGAVPLIPFLLGMDASAIIASIMTGMVFLAIGAAKSLWSLQRWWSSALETFFIGMFAAGLAYGIGVGLRALVQI